MHALIQNDQIIQIGPLPPIWWDGDRWHDLRDDDGTQAAALGWLPVTYEPRPDDTATTTWDRDEPALVDGLPVIGWTERPWTEAEQAAEAEQNARLVDLDSRVARIEAYLWPADPDPEPDAPIDAPTWGDYGGVWPNGKLLSDDGTVWRNVSGVPLTTPPSGFPGEPSQWGHLFAEITSADPDPGDPDPVDEWPAWTPWDGHNANLHQIGAQVTHIGRRWTSTAANNHWEPGVYGWVDAGPAPS